MAKPQVRAVYSTDFAPQNNAVSPPKAAPALNHDRAAPIQQVAPAQTQQPVKPVFAPQPAINYNAVNYGYSMIPNQPAAPTKKP